MGGRETEGLSEPERNSAPVRGGKDQCAFEELRAGLHRYLRRELRHPQDVEDLAQEVYLRLLRFTAAESVRFPKAYVFRVAFNVLYEFKHRRRVGQVDFDSIAADR